MALILDPDWQRPFTLPYTEYSQVEMSALTQMIRELVNTHQLHVHVPGAPTPRMQSKHELLLRRRKNAPWNF